MCGAAGGGQERVGARLESAAAVILGISDTRTNENIKISRNRIKKNVMIRYRLTNYTYVGQDPNYVNNSISA